MSTSTSPSVGGCNKGLSFANSFLGATLHSPANAKRSERGRGLISQKQMCTEVRLLAEKLTDRSEDSKIGPFWTAPGFLGNLSATIKP